MAKKIKISRKQIKKPDEFITWSERAWDWAEENIWIAVGVLAGAVIVFLLIQGLILWMKSSSQNPRQDLAAAADILRAPIVADDQMYFPGLSNGYKSEKEKYEAASNSFKSLAENYAGDPEGQLAMLYLAGTYEKLGDNDAALKYYETFRDTKIAKKEKYLATPAIMGIGRIQYLREEYQQASETFQEVMAADDAFKVDAMIEYARCLYKMGKEDDAKKVLSNVKDRFPDSQTAQAADFLAMRWEEKKIENQHIKIDLKESTLDVGESSVEPLSASTANE